MTFLTQTGDRYFQPNNSYVWSTIILKNEDEEESLEDANGVWTISIQRDGFPPIVIDINNSPFATITNITEQENNKFLGVDISVEFTAKDTMKMAEYGKMKVLIQQGEGADRFFHFWHYLIPSNQAFF